jgi:hypothetical protein
MPSIRRPGNLLRIPFAWRLVVLVVGVIPEKAAKFPLVLKKIHGLNSKDEE